MLLDEPTVGVDPQSRDRIYDMLAELAQSGVSLLLTTHHLEEAEARCSRTVIIDHGKVIAAGTMPELVRSDGRPPPPRHASPRRAARCGCRPIGIAGHGEPISADAADRRIVQLALHDVGAELPPLLDRIRRGRPVGRRRRGARAEPAVGLHSSHRKGVARIMGTLLRIGWTNLRRDRVAQALTFVLPIVFFSIFAMVFGQQGDASTARIRIAVVDEDQSEVSAPADRGAAGRRRACGCARPPTRRRPGRRSIAPAPNGWCAAATCRLRSSFPGARRRLRQERLRRRRARRSSCSSDVSDPDRAADGAGPAAEGGDDGGAGPDDAGRHPPVRSLRRRAHRRSSGPPWTPGCPS